MNQTARAHGHPRFFSAFTRSQPLNWGGGLPSSQPPAILRKLSRFHCVLPASTFVAQGRPDEALRRAGAVNRQSKRLL